ncbi:phenylacetate--CoA ligase family protein [Sulfurisoma sediminicola]|uniref:Phenylacetate-CoA ligase n=1 Tax=Sulfurisoma sediminicola TaxID=1381557 RepID=A0A497XDU1_9PROT|nr:AMP-binding protein [Sulfurisoma sediminicola]RLJ65140.1 phenylacetate-CoA ligase [Sulfurisoma sediminicola]
MSAGLRDWLHRRRHPERFALLDELLRNQTLTREQLLHKQREDLAAIIVFAAANSDFYAAHLAGRNAIADLPILTKDDVARHRDALLVRGPARAGALLGYTGGSTGQPLAFWWDRTKHELMRAGMMRSYMGSGWRPGERIVNFWGAAQDIRGGGLRRRYGAWVSGETTLAAREFDEGRLAQWAAFIQAYGPVLLQGYASILAALAHHMLRRRIAPPATLRGIYSTAEVLTDEQREAMERAFGCKVFNQYGSREIPNIACECRRGNMHVFSDMVFLESADGDGAPRLLVTSLTNRLMPMIRYDIGDSGRLREGGCDCGWPFPLMEMGMCRQNDLIRTRDGRLIHPSFFNGLLYGTDGIRAYRFVQRAPDHMVLDLVADPPLSRAAEEAMRGKIGRELDAPMTLAINYVDAIPRTASGKHRFVVSELGR